MTATPEQISEFLAHVCGHSQPVEHGEYIIDGVINVGEALAAAMNPAPSPHLVGAKITPKQLRDKADFAEELGYRDHANTLRDAADTIEAVEGQP